MITDSIKAVLIFFSRYRQITNALAFILVATLSLGIGEKRKIIAFVIAASVIALNSLLEYVVEGAQQSDEQVTNEFSKIHAGCLQLITEAVQTPNLYSRRNKLENAQTGLLRLIGNGAEYLAGLKYSELTVNLMVPINDEALKLVKFSTPRRYRSEGERLLALNSELPGAPKAFVNGSIEYVDDITQYPVFDGQRPYRSILSFPLILMSPKRCVGVVNIDSETVNAFTDEAIIRIDNISSDWLQTLALTVDLYNQARLEQKED